MPAEWEPHEATWLAWPHEPNDWPGKLDAVCWVYVEIVRQLSAYEPVRVLVENATAAKRAGEMLAKGGADAARYELLVCPTNRSWVRDSAPTFTGEAAVSWKFTGWQRYANWRKDRRVGEFVAQAAGYPLIQPRHKGKRVILEGGAIDVNGAGSLLTTTECLLDGETARHPGWSRADWEAVFAKHLSVGHVIWLGRGVAGDDTGGHVDDLARFTGPRTVAAPVETNSADDNFGPLSENLKALAHATDQNGKTLDIIELPMPRPLYFDGVRVPASYANFYIANGAVLVPTFNDPHDRVALRALETAFPSRDVIGIHAVDLVWGFGTLHCGTQQQPKRG